MTVDTLAKLFWRRVETSGDRPAQMLKRDGAWVTLTWREVGAIVREVALGLVALGRQPGDTVALLSQSRAEWVQTDFAIFSAGGVTVPIYPTYPPDLIAYVVNDAGARTLIVEDAAQLEKALAARPSMPQLEHIVVIAPGAAAVAGAGVMTWEALRALGREGAARH
ncbi:MAG TPA: AMP-binding protein, partial [Dehalococcoidia bacterium]|nr:AMP-binding protein [Dehalococcoidia bacterium]